MSALPHLHLTCFGPPTALLEGRAPPREVLWQKHLGLLIYLALSPDHRRTRSHLVGMFWPEMPEHRARKALNEAVLRLRKHLGTARLRTEGNALWLNDHDLDVDAIEFAAAAKISPPPDHAAPLLRGDFLEGFAVDAAPAFEEWSRVEAERYRALAAVVLVATGERRLGASQFTDAADAARRALSYAPYSEPAQRLLMRAAALGGDAASALAAFKVFATRLQSELGERPSASITALAERIRHQNARTETFPVEGEPPLVGRQTLYRDAFQVVARGLVRGPTTLVVTAVPGMGRSRLLEEAKKRAALDGALEVSARPIESDQDAPWSTLRLLLRGGLTDAPGFPGARPEALSALAGLLPELGDHIRARPVFDVADMAAAFGSVLDAISEERPIVLALDDAHWADGASLAALTSAIRQLPSSRLAFLVSAARGVGNPPRELVLLQSDVGRGLTGISVRLDPLELEDIRLLVRAIATWCHTEVDSDRLSRRVAFETAGNPFFAVTLLKALTRATTFRGDLMAWPPAQGTFDASLPFSIPLVRLAIALRLGELSKEEQVILRAASAVGQVLNLDVISFVAERTLTEVERAVQAFEQRALIAFDGQRYMFTAPIVCEVLRNEGLSRGELCRLEQRAIEALAGQTDLESRVRRAELLGHAQAHDTTVEFAVAVTREAIDAGTVRLARRALAVAERLGRGSSADRARLEDLRSRM